MATATRWTIRQEPYDPDARDADNDGIVQEQTPWERPAGTSLVDELGRAITRGANAGQRPRGLRVVDQRGNPVDYTPTYERPGFSFGGGGTPLGEAGAPSLRERGLPSVRDITAPPPAPQMEPSLAPSLPPAVGLPGADAPEPPALRVDGRPKASAKEMAEASRIAKSIQESVEAEFGPLTTKEQVRDALNRAFPNASGNAEALLNSAEYWDENPPRVKAVRNFAIGLLHMSQQDPQTAARITRLTDLDTKDPNAGGVHMTRADIYSGTFQSWAIAMNPWLNVNSLEPEKREMGEPWAYKMALSMKETGDFSDDEINQILQQSVAIHEFGHAMHLSAGLSHWGSDRGGAIPSEAMIQAFANVKKISVSDANDEINAFIQKYDTRGRSDQTISEAITTLVRREPEGEQAFFNELYDTIKWDGVDGDETVRSKILEDLSKASEYATTGGKRGAGSQYDEGIAETIAVMVATGTPASGGEEMLAHVQSIFPGSAAPPSPSEPEVKPEGRQPARISGTFAEIFPKWEGEVAEITKALRTHERSDGYENLALREIQKRQGFDGLPEVVPATEWQDFLDSNPDHIPIFRGVAPWGGDASASDLVEQFRSGPYFAGNGIFGAGTYTSADAEDARVYMGRERGDTSTDGLIEMLIRPDARIIEWADAYELNGSDSDLDKHINDTDDEPSWDLRDITNDTGRTAAMFGYDVILVKDKDSGEGDFYILLNRTAVVVKGAEGK